MKNKIVFFCGSLQSGGAERVLSELTKRLVRKFKVVIILYYHKDIFYQLDSRVKVISLEKITNSKSIFLNSIKLRHIVKKENPSIFVSFLVPFNILSFFSLIGSRIPKIICERTDPNRIKANYILRVFRYLAYRNADGLVFQTQRQKEYFSEKIQAHSVVICNPSFVSIDFKGYALQCEKKNRIVTVSRIHPCKNLPLLINAFSNVVKNYPNIVLDIYGTGDELYMASIQQLVINLGLTNSVRLKGTSNNIYSEISDALFYISSSDFEGMSNAVMEAISVGLPVISTNVSGAFEMIKNNDNGFIVDVGDEYNLTDKMQVLLASPKLCKQMSYSSVLISSRFAFDNIYEQWEKYFLLIINQNIAASH